MEGKQHGPEGSSYALMLTRFQSESRAWPLACAQTWGQGNETCPLCLTLDGGEEEMEYLCTQNIRRLPGTKSVSTVRSHTRKQWLHKRSLTVSEHHTSSQKVRGRVLPGKDFTLKSISKVLCQSEVTDHFFERLLPSVHFSPSQTMFTLWRLSTKPDTSCMCFPWNTERVLSGSNMWYQFIFLSNSNKESTDFKNKKGVV